LAKFWTDPRVSLAASWGLSSRELSELERIIEERQDLIRRKWDEYFND